MNARMGFNLKMFVFGAFLISACTTSIQTAPERTSQESAPTEEKVVVQEPSRTPDTQTGVTESDTPNSPIDEPEKPTGAAFNQDYEIVTLLPPDAIPAIDNPKFYSAEEADREYEPDEMVIGVAIDGESKAYSTPHLDRHEIVNDTLGGRKIAVTW